MTEMADTIYSIMVWFGLAGIVALVGFLLNLVPEKKLFVVAYTFLSVSMIYAVWFGPLYNNKANEQHKRLNKKIIETATLLQTHRHERAEQNRVILYNVEMEPICPKGTTWSILEDGCINNYTYIKKYWRVK